MHTAIGLDVHARSIKACALNPMTGEVERASFGYDPASVAEWALSFESPKAVYESGVNGFHLCRVLRALGLDCAPPAPVNLPLREDGTHDFRAAAPNELWVTDITEFRLPCGAKCYPSPVIDCFDGRPVAWSIGRHPTARLANSSLEAACGTLAPGEAPAVHSDRGGHYRWPRWIAICEANGLARSMSRKGMSMSCVDVQ